MTSDFFFKSSRMRLTVCKSRGIEDDDVPALCPLYTIVAALSGTAVLLVVIMQIKDACVLVANILAWFL